MHLLDEGAHAQRLVVEQRPFVVVLLRHAARRQLQPRPADIGRRHQDHPAAFGDAIGNIELLQFVDDVAAVLARSPA